MHIFQHPLHNYTITKQLNHHSAAFVSVRAPLPSQLFSLFLSQANCSGQMVAHLESGLLDVSAFSNAIFFLSLSLSHSRRKHNSRESRKPTSVKVGPSRLLQSGNETRRWPGFGFSALLTFFLRNFLEGCFLFF